MEPRIDGLDIGTDLVAAIVRHCTSALPAEGCGLVGGRRVGMRWSADRFFPGTNRLASPTRFSMEPAEVLAALTAIQRDGDELVAIVHSHPTTAASPSRTDLREVAYPDALLVIVSFAAGERSPRAWRVDDVGPGVRAAEVPIWLQRGASA